MLPKSNRPQWFISRSQQGPVTVASQDPGQPLQSPSPRGHPPLSGWSMPPKQVNSPLIDLWESSSGWKIECSRREEQKACDDCTVLLHTTFGRILSKLLCNLSIATETGALGRFPSMRIQIGQYHQCANLYLRSTSIHPVKVELASNSLSDC